jgi:hypothetical protein
MEQISGNEESLNFDSSVDILASGIETKAWNVVICQSFIFSFFVFAKKKIEKLFRNKLSFWRSNDNSSYIQM